jgi:septum formation protein
METIILASASPRRKEIFESLSIPFRVLEAGIDESRYEHLRIGPRVMKLAEDKVTAVLDSIPGAQPGWVAGFDTLIGQNGKIIGKPENPAEARQMIAGFSGKAHYVFTGVALFSKSVGKIITRFCKSKVFFKKMSRTEIDFYIATGEWQGVAGAYRIQEKGALFIESIKGSYSNIVGLPISLFYGMLLDANYPFY